MHEQHLRICFRHGKPCVFGKRQQLVRILKLAGAAGALNCGQKRCAIGMCLVGGALVLIEQQRHDSLGNGGIPRVARSG